MDDLDQLDGLALHLHHEHLDAGGPDFTELRKVLGQANTFMASRMKERQASEGADSNGAPEQPGAGSVIQTGVMRGEPRSREDVVRALDGICAYYARNEPSSPVPLLLERAKRLVPKNFFEIMEDLAPDGMAQLTAVSGQRE